MAQGFSEAAIGRLGAVHLSYSTLANSAYSIMGISVVWGGAAGMETLCGQAYGAGNQRLMRLVLLRAVAICWAICLPVVLLWGHAEYILVSLLGQTPSIAAGASLYLQVSVQ